MSEVKQEEVNALKQQQQRALLSSKKLIYLGSGPAATGVSCGWRMSPYLYFRCVLCGYFMDADPLKDDQCFCGAMSKDASWGRFSFKLGDDKVEVYKAVPNIKTDSRLK